jgi:hypothetical protein
MRKSKVVANISGSMLIRAAPCHVSRPEPSMHHSRSTWPPVVRLVAIGSVAGAAWRGHHGHCAENEVMPPARGGRWPEPRSDPARSTDRRRPWRPAAVVRPPTPQQHSDGWPAATPAALRRHQHTRSRCHTKSSCTWASRTGSAQGTVRGALPASAVTFGCFWDPPDAPICHPRRGDPF